MAHVMMLSDLYGRIGQTLREHGDAPIGIVKSPLFPNEPHLVDDYIYQMYCKVTHVTTEINGVEIYTYELLIDDGWNEK